MRSRSSRSAAAMRSRSSRSAAAMRASFSARSASLSARRRVVAAARRGRAGGGRAAMRAEAAAAAAAEEKGAAAAEREEAPAARARRAAGKRQLRRASSIQLTLPPEHRRSALHETNAPARASALSARERLKVSSRDGRGRRSPRTEAQRLWGIYSDSIARARATALGSADMRPNSSQVCRSARPLHTARARRSLALPFAPSHSSLGPSRER